MPGCASGEPAGRHNGKEDDTQEEATGNQEKKDSREGENFRQEEDHPQESKQMKDMLL